MSSTPAGQCTVEISGAGDVVEHPMNLNDTVKDILDLVSTDEKKYGTLYKDGEDEPRGDTESLSDLGATAGTKLEVRVQ